MSWPREALRLKREIREIGAAVVSLQTTDRDAARQAVVDWLDGPLAQTTGTSLDNLLEQRKRAKSRGIWSVALARELVSRAEHRDPECMCTMVPVCEPGSWIHIAVNCMYSARVPKRRIQLIGAALAAAVCALESAGNRVWVTAFWGVTGYDEGSAWLCSLTLKEYLSELDTDCLGFWVTNASAFRRVIFSLMETHPVEFRELFGVSADGGYGSPFCAEQHDAVFEALGADLVLGLGADRIDSVDEAIGWVNQTLESYSADSGG